MNRKYSTLYIGYDKYYSTGSILNEYLSESKGSDVQ